MQIFILNLPVIENNTLRLRQLLLLEILKQLLLQIRLQILWLQLLLKVLLQLLHLHPFLTDFDLVNHVLDPERIIIRAIAIARYLLATLGAALIEQSAEKRRLTRPLRIWLLIRVPVAPLVLPFVLVYAAFMLSIELTEGSFPVLQTALL